MMATPWSSNAASTKSSTGCCRRRCANSGRPREHQAGPHLGQRQERPDDACVRPGGAGRRDHLDLGDGVVPGRCRRARDDRRGADRGARAPRRPREDAPLDAPRGDPRPARPRRRHALAGGRRDRADRPRRLQPLSVPVGGDAPRRARARGDREHRHRRPRDGAGGGEELPLGRRGDRARPLRLPARRDPERPRASCRSTPAATWPPRRSPTSPPTTPPSRPGSRTPSPSPSGSPSTCSRSRTSPTARTRTSAPPSIARPAPAGTCCRGSSSTAESRSRSTT